MYVHIYTFVSWVVKCHRRVVAVHGCDNTPNRSNIWEDGLMWFTVSDRFTV